MLYLKMGNSFSKHFRHRGKEPLTAGFEVEERGAPQIEVHVGIVPFGEESSIEAVDLESLGEVVVFVDDHLPEGPLYGEQGVYNSFNEFGRELRQALC